MLTNQQIERYSRQLLLPEMSGSAQSKLFASSVLVCGDGLLTDTLATYLRRAGVGTIRVDSAWFQTAPPDMALPVQSTSAKSLSQVDAVVVAVPIRETEAEQILASGVPTWLIETTGHTRLIGPLTTTCAARWCAGCIARIPGIRGAPRDGAVDLVAGSFTALAVLRQLLGLPASTSSCLIDAESEEWITVARADSCQHHKTLDN